MFTSFRCLIFPGSWSVVLTGSCSWLLLFVSWCSLRFWDSLTVTQVLLRLCNLPQRHRHALLATFVYLKCLILSFSVMFLQRIGTVGFSADIPIVLYSLFSSRSRMHLQERSMSDVPVTVSLSAKWLLSGLPALGPTGKRPKMSRPYLGKVVKPKQKLELGKVVHACIQSQHLRQRQDDLCSSTLNSQSSCLHLLSAGTQCVIRSN